MREGRGWGRGGGEAGVARRWDGVPCPQRAAEAPPGAAGFPTPEGTPWRCGPRPRMGDVTPVAGANLRVFGPVSPRSPQRFPRCLWSGVENRRSREGRSETQALGKRGGLSRLRLQDLGSESGQPPAPPCVLRRSFLSWVADFLNCAFHQSRRLSLPGCPSGFGGGVVSFLTLRSVRAGKCCGLFQCIHLLLPKVQTHGLCWLLGNPPRVTSGRGGTMSRRAWLLVGLRRSHVHDNRPPSPSAFSPSRDLLAGQTGARPEPLSPVLGPVRQAVSTWTTSCGSRPAVQPLLWPRRRERPPPGAGCPPGAEGPCGSGAAEGRPGHRQVPCRSLWTPRDVRAGPVPL